MIILDFLNLCFLCEAVSVVKATWCYIKQFDVSVCENLSVGAVVKSVSSLLDRFVYQSIEGHWVLLFTWIKNWKMQWNSPALKRWSYAIDICLSSQVHQVYCFFHGDFTFQFIRQAGFALSWASVHLNENMYFLSCDLLVKWSFVFVMKFKSSIIENTDKLFIKFLIDNLF